MAGTADRAPRGRRARLWAAGLAAACLTLGHLSIVPRPAAGAVTVRYVDDDAGCDGQRPCYQSIQAAVDAAHDGDVVSIAPGRYVESVLVVDKSLVFEGAGAGAPGTPDDPSTHSVWSQPGPPAPGALTIDARTRSITGVSVSGIRFVDLTTGLRLVGRRAGDPVAPPLDLAASTLDTSVVGATLSGNELRGAPGAFPAGRALTAWWCDGLRFEANRVVGALTHFLGGSGLEVASNRFTTIPGTAIALGAQGSNLVLRDNEIETTDGPAVRIEPLLGTGLRGSASAITLSDNRIDRAGREGVYASVTQGGHLTGLAIRGGRISGAGTNGTAEVHGAVALVGGGDRLRHVTLEGVDVRGTLTGSLGSRAGLYADAVGGTIAVTGTTISHCAGPGIVSVDVQELRVWSSEITRNAVGIQLTERTGRRGTMVVGGSADASNRLGGNSRGAMILRNETGSSVSTSDVLATHNHWGTAVGPAIEDAIHHRPDDIVLGVVTYLPAMAAPERLEITADPPSLVADGSSQARLALHAADRGGDATADDTLVVLSTNGGSLDRPGATVEAESDGVGRRGEWGTYDSMQFGPFRGEGYVRSDDAGATLTWIFDAEAVLVRYAQAVLNTGTLSVTLDGEALAPLETRGPESAWVERVIARGLGPGTHVITLTVGSGEVNVDMLAAGTTTRDGVAQARLRSGTSMGFGRVAARAYGANGPRDATLDVPFTAGQPADLEIGVSEPVLPVGGVTTTVTVTATDGIGRPVPDGTSVRLAASLGIVSPSETVTLRGIARATYRTGELVGRAEVRAESGAAFTITGVSVVPGPPDRLEVTAARSSIPANGTTTTDVAVSVRDAFGNAVADGTPVTVSTDLGTLESVALSTTGGVARMLLRSGNVIGTATVIASCGSAKGSTTVRFTGTDLRLAKEVEPSSAVVPGESVTFTLSFANVGSGVVYDAILDDMLPTGLISAVVRTPSGQRVERLADRPLAFRLERVNPGQAGDIIVVLKVDTSLLWGPRSVITNTATFASALAAELTPVDNADSVGMIVLPGAVYTVTVTAPSEIVAGGATAKVRARLTDRYGNPSRDGTVVSFATDLGSIAPALTTTRDGAAEATLVSGTRAGTATVRALTLEERGASARVRIAPGPPSRLALSSEHDSVLVGGETTVMTATVTDQYANGVSAPVSFETDHGLLSRREATTDAMGVATATLRSGVRTAIATVTARRGTLSRSKPIPFRAAAPAGIELSLSRWRLRVGDTAEATATVLDRFGNAVPDQPVDYTSNIAAVRHARVDTDSAGRAVTTLTALRPGSGVVRAVTGAFTAVRVLTVDAGRAYVPFAVR